MYRFLPPPRPVLSSLGYGTTPWGRARRICEDCSARTADEGSSWTRSSLCWQTGSQRRDGEAWIGDVGDLEVQDKLCLGGLWKKQCHCLSRPQYSLRRPNSQAFKYRPWYSSQHNPVPPSTDSVRIVLLFNATRSFLWRHERPTNPQMAMGL